MLRPKMKSNQSTEQIHQSSSDRPPENHHSGRRLPDVLIVKALKTCRCPVPHAMSNGRLNSLTLDAVRKSTPTAAGSLAAVVTPSKLEVVAPPGTQVQADMETDQDRSDVCVAFELDRGQSTAAAGERRASRNALRLRPRNGLLTEGAFVEGVGRDLKLAPLLVALRGAAETSTEEVETEAGARGIGANANLRNIGAMRGRRPRKRSRHKLDELAARRRGKGLRRGG